MPIRFSETTRGWIAAVAGGLSAGTAGWMVDRRMKAATIRLKKEYVELREANWRADREFLKALEDRSKASTAVYSRPGPIYIKSQNCCRVRSCNQTAGAGLRDWSNLAPSSVAADGGSSVWASCPPGFSCGCRVLPPFSCRASSVKRYLCPKILSSAAPQPKLHSDELHLAIARGDHVTDRKARWWWGRALDAGAIQM
ncbi:BQ5605_C001g00226 [Microbotryum silenes-dioicae]|uniref:BQ5605_C001g00226 protein n=1 Tax=Microbotryum silenes-dioicae TaxID=796604 RepID=A0A2X0P5L4_9BASI|nr:BQ5605_C001g00226 [Microbotryum silenes-dioicae]